jgi:hypothetical protein
MHPNTAPPAPIMLYSALHVHLGRLILQTNNFYGPMRHNAEKSLGKVITLWENVITFWET